MADTELTTMEPQTRNSRPLPTEIVLRAEEMEVGFTPRELRMVRDALGRSWSQIVADLESDDKFLVFAWLRLRRDGYDVGLEAVDDIVIRITTDEAPPDPTSVEPSRTSPASVTSGE